MLIKIKNMVPVVKFILPVVFSLMLTTALAQKPKATTKPGTPAAQKFILPKLTCFLASYSDSATIFVEEAVQLITFPLKVTDAKKNVYTVISYNVIYKRQGVTEDEETGKVSPATSNVAQNFKETPIPGIWKKILLEQLKPGEEIYFFDIVAKDAQGRLMFAPNLKLKTK